MQAPMRRTLAWQLPKGYKLCGNEKPRLIGAFVLMNTHVISNVISINVYYRP